jgi:hypothetical protein
VVVPGSDCAEELVDCAELRVVEPAPRRSDNDPGHHDRHEVDGPVEVPESELAIENQRQRQPDDERRRHGHQRPQRRVLDCAPEVGVAMEELAEVVEPDEDLRRADAVPVEEAQSERLDDRIRDEKAEDEQGGEDEERADHAPASTTGRRPSGDGKTGFRSRARGDTACCVCGEA